jgi:hypothetical protein
MRAIRHLQKSHQVRSNIIERGSYSGHRETITEDPAQARQEYIDNMLSSDLALVVKGDGNYSYRFYEALSLGRVPLFIDTDCVLPLDDVIDYDSFIFRVPYSDIHRLGSILREEWNAWQDAEFQSMQRDAREAYQTYLRPDRFLRYAIENLL